jgi:hypothetical protein
MQVLSEIPFQLDLDSLRAELHVLPESDDAAALEKLADRCLAEGRPKAIYRESFVDARTPDSITIDGIVFRSRVLRMNMEKAERVFPFIVTCGTEFDRIDVPADDLLGLFWLDAVKARALHCARKHLNDHLDRRYALGKTSSMNPGSGDATVWPIEQQKELFSLLGSVKERIGVVLTDSFLMIPNKTVSGIRFPTELDFRSCQLCHREKCASRSAPFDKALWEATRD